MVPSHDGSNQLQMAFKEMVKVRKGKRADLIGIENNVKVYRRQTAEMCPKTRIIPDIVLTEDPQLHLCRTLGGCSQRSSGRVVH